MESGDWIAAGSMKLTDSWNRRRGDLLSTLLLELLAHMTVAHGGQ